MSSFSSVETEQCFGWPAYLPACLRAVGSSQDQACLNTCWLEKPGKQAQSLSPKPSECRVQISANSTSTQESQVLKTFSI